MTKHFYSGWPGAWCLNCGEPDPIEEALAHGCDTAVCRDCGKSYPQLTDPCIHESKIFGSDTWNHDVITEQCGEHGTDECREPGSARYNPYVQFRGLIVPEFHSHSE